MNASNTSAKLACRCGAVQGRLQDLSGEHYTRVVCYCRDCQAFARHLDHAGGWLDRYGGTAVLQCSPARLEIEQGDAQIAVLRLGPKGLYRWYTRCCASPIGNTTPVRQLPFFGLVESFMREPSGDAIDRRFGADRVGVFAENASVEPSAIEASWSCHERVPMSLFAVSARNLAQWRLRGDHRRSPFFAVDTGKPIVEPSVLDKKQRQLAYESVDRQDPA